jgi:hypothetical protein
MNNKQIEEETFKCIAAETKKSCCKSNDIRIIDGIKICSYCGTIPSKQYNLLSKKQLDKEYNTILLNSGINRV